MRIQTKTHNMKNTTSHVSPKAQLVAIENRHRSGASGANCFAKKNSNPISINPIPI